MDYFRPFIDQLTGFWREASQLSRFGMVATLLISIGMIVSVGLWSSQPHYVVLAEDLSPDKAAQVVDKLEKENIACKLSYSGSSVMVAESKLNRARGIAAELIPREQMASVEKESWNAGPAERRQLRQRKLEARLANTIMQLRAVEHAVVHLYIAKSSPVESMQKVSTASVLVKVRPGADFSTYHGDSIASMVANSVEGLGPENVKVLDDHGKVLSTQEGIFGGGMTQVSLKRDTEKYLKYKAESILTQMLGPGKASVTVAAHIDVRKIESRIRQYNPEERIAKSEKRVVETSKDKLARPGGPAGTSANLSNFGASQSNGTTTTREREESESEFDFGLTETTQSELPDWVKRISIAAVVDLSAPEGEEQAQPRIDVKAIEMLIRSAVGFDETRGDSIKVVDTKLIGIQIPDEEELIEPAQQQEFILKLVRSSSLGLGALFATVIGFLLLRKIKPVKKEEPKEQLSHERAKHLSQLSTFANEHPEVVSRIIAAWVDEPEQDEGVIERREAA